MPKKIAPVLCTFALALLWTGCDLIGGVFKAGFGVGIVIAVIVLLVIFMFFRGRGKGSTP